MFKRIFDIVVAVSALLLLSPVIIVSALFLLISQGHPIFFSQARPGIHGKIFTMVKFCSMNNKLDHQGNLLADSERLTTFGKFIRATSIDELPGLWNVLTGEMSLVGPRPLLVEYLPLYSTDQARRHQVKPGITGWAQVNGRNAISWQEKFELDVWYVDNQSFGLDIKILLLTVKKVLARHDINADNTATMEKFTGSKNHRDSL